MTVRIEIFGEIAGEALRELAIIAGALTAPTIVEVKPSATKVMGQSSAAEATQDNALAHTGTSTTAPTVASPSDEEVPAAPKRRGRPPKAKDTGTSEPSQESNATSSVTSPAAAEAESAQNDTSEDDEFAAFRSAMAKTEETDEKAAASVPDRKWTDADLSALNNQAAQKVGPARVPEIKAIVAKYVPDGEVPHSRNIPEGDRATYAREIEELAGIEFAG